MMKVAIHCLAYNHEPYIRKCLDGFVMQKTDFSFIAVVHDDASTDGTAEVIREYAERYPDIIRPIFETENQYSKHDGSIGRIMDAAIDETGADYVAMCEGDDFWTDPHKLQKQADILDADKSLMGVVTDTAVVDMDGNVITPKRGGVIPSNQEGKYDIRDFFTEPTHKYPTATVMYRNTHKEEIRKKLAQTANAFLGDWNLWIILHLYGDFYFLNQVTSAYRVNPASVTHTEGKVERAWAGVEICNSIADILPEEYSDIAKRLRHKKKEVWVSLAHAYLAKKQYLKVLGCIFLSIFLCPKQLMAAFRQWVLLVKGEREMF